MPTAVTFHPIPPVYRVFFTILDPAITVWAAYLYLFARPTVLSSVTPTQLLPPPDIQAKLYAPLAFLFVELAGFFAASAILQASLLRRTTDATVWRHVQAMFLVAELFVLAGTAQAYRAQGRLWSPGTWRPEDWGAIAITAFCALTRAAFLSGVGMRQPPIGTVKRS